MAPAPAACAAFALSVLQVLLMGRRAAALRVTVVGVARRALGLSAATESTGACEAAQRFDLGRAVVHLRVPADAGSRIQHDGYLALLVGRVGHSLDVVLGASAPAPDAAPPAEVLAYTSELYLTLWDLMLEARNVRLNCTVHVADAVAVAAELVRDADAVFTEDPAAPVAEAARAAGVAVEPLEPPATSPKTRVVFIDDPQGPVPTYSKLALGGTFDGLHNGHRKLLTMALAVAKPGATLTVGVTGAEMLRSKKHAELIAPLAHRMSGVRDFCKRLRPDVELELVELRGKFGPLCTAPEYEALVLSSETLVGSERINELRAEHGVGRLDFVVARRQGAATLSSTFVRRSAAEDSRGGS